MVWVQIAVRKARAEQQKAGEAMPAGAQDRSVRGDRQVGAD
jgi:hypothetical protein